MSDQLTDHDSEIIAITKYVMESSIDSKLAYETAYYDLLDSIACAILALKYPACTQLLGPLVPELSMKNGTPIMGTNYKLDPIQAAFDIGTLIRWLDFNDTWLAAEWGHPSDNLGALLAVGDYMNRHHNKNFTVQDILTYLIKSHEIQGVLALENSFNQVGLDHVLLVKIASAACVAAMLGMDDHQVAATLSQAWIDGQSLRTYRHAPNAGPRKSWAAGDATARAVRLALLVRAGAHGYPSALTVPTWGFQAVSFKGKSLQRSQPYNSYVMENILWKISFPAEFHGQTAIECALKLYPEIKDRLDKIDRIEIETQEAAMRIINKTGSLNNPAARDHCIQYMSAVGLIFGDLKAEYYENDFSTDPRIDKIRSKINIQENVQFSKDYLDPNKRSIANSMQIYFTDGTSTEKVTVEYPIGHKKRRSEGIPLLKDKFKTSIQSHYPEQQAGQILEVCLNQKSKLLAMPIDKFMDSLSLITT